MGRRVEQGEKSASGRSMLRYGLSALVFVVVQSIESATLLSREFLHDGVTVNPIYADRSHAESASAIRTFTEGSVCMLIWTYVLVQGLQFLAMNTVRNYWRKW